MKRSAIALAFLAFILLSLTPAVSAGSVDVSGLDRNTGPNVELYVTSGALDVSELALIINYDDYEAVLRVAESNGTTVQTQVIDPHSSMFLELSFPDMTTYKITMSIQSHTVLTITRERSANVLPTPDVDNSWHITAPDAEKATYTQAMVNAIISALTLDVLVKATVMAIIGMFIGAIVKRVTLFLVPFDMLSITFCVVVLSDAFLNWAKVGIGLFYLPMLAGYFLGFFLAHVSYVMIEKDNLGEKTSVRQAVVLYNPDEEIGQCIQQQSNRALIKRWLGYHHRLGADAGIAPDWADSTKYPYFPKFRKMIVMIEDSVTEYEDVPIFFGLFKVRTFTTYWRLSNASKCPKMLWKKSAASFLWARDMIDRVYADLVTERQKNRMVATQVSAEMHTYTIKRSTHQAIYDQFAKPLPPMTIPQTQENVMRPITRPVASPQAMPEDTEPEDTERDRKKSDIEEDSEPEMNEKDEKKVVKNGRNRSKNMA